MGAAAAWAVPAAGAALGLVGSMKQASATKSAANALAGQGPKIPGDIQGLRQSLAAQFDSFVNSGDMFGFQSPQVAQAQQNIAQFTNPNYIRDNLMSLINPDQLIQ